jgi:single-strand DNA-binding protein
MPSFNKVIIAGNLTRDPELRYTPKGTAIAGISVAVNRKWKAESGELKEEVTFVDCTAFGRTAEVIAQYLKKGSPLLVEGRLRTESWEDKNTGQKRSKMSVVLETFQFLASGQREQQGAAATGEEPAGGTPAVVDAEDVQRARQLAAQRGAENPQPDAPEQDDVPF